MTTANLMRRAVDAGVRMSLDDAGLQLQADRQPSGELLAELIAHKFEIIAALSAANDPPASSAWLARVARLLGIWPAELLEGGHLEPHDLAELAGMDAALVADKIRVGLAWINRPQRVEQPLECEDCTEVGVEPQHGYTAATATPEWITARDQYLNHRMACSICRTPRCVHCVAGAELRQRYDDTPMEPTV
jgi:hypothetical protein